MENKQENESTIVHEIDTCFVSLFRSELQSNNQNISYPSDEESWQRLMKLAKFHNMIPIIYKQAKEHLPFQNILNQWKSKAIQEILSQEIRTKCFLEIYEKLKEVDPVVVKGIIVREVYPEPEARLSADEDIIISKEMYTKCEQILLENDYVYCSAIGEEDTVFRHKETGFVLEVHRNPFRLHSVYDFLNKPLEGWQQRCIFQTIQGRKLKSLGHTDHLLYLIGHSCQHFIGEGAGIRQIADIAMYSRAYNSFIDWDQLIKCLKQCNLYDYWCVCLAVSINYLGFSKEEIHAYDLSKETMDSSTLLLKDSLEGGIFGQGDLSRSYGANITRRSVEEVDKAGFQYVFKSLFPSVQDVEYNYPWIKEKPYMLPYVWLLRWIKYIRKTKDKHSMVKPMMTGKKRLSLIRRLNIKNK